MIKITRTSAGLLAGAALTLSANAVAVELEVTHWWTSGGEAAAVAVLADAFDATGNTWVDGAIAGGGGVARPIMISRITGGDPMAATQFNHGRQAEELVEAGLMQDLSEVAEAEGWADLVNPSTLLDSCTLDGKVYCVPVNIHSWQWIWLSHAAFEAAGTEVPASWEEFVAAGPALREAGKIPLALGGQAWQSNGLFDVLMPALGGEELYIAVKTELDAEAVRSEEMTRVFEAAATARELARGSNVQDWNQATNLVITGQAGGQIMGDWAQGEFAVAGQVAGEDYSCLPGLGDNEVISTAGDAFYFPKLDDPEKTAAQLELASVMMSRQVQVAFNLKKGSLPVRGDVDLAAANDCMKKGLALLAEGKTLPSGDQTLSADTTTQLEDLMVEFFKSDMKASDAQEQYAQIMEDAD